MNIIKLIISIAVCLIAGLVGSLFTYRSIPTWYTFLAKPALNPPNWIFGPVWTTLYILMGISAYLIWQAGYEKKEVQDSLTVFGIQLLINILWSILFFGMKSPLYGLICIILLWFSIVSNIMFFRKISKPAAWLLLPYILWVSFAGYLNLWIWILNR